MIAAYHQCRNDELCGGAGQEWERPEGHRPGPGLAEQIECAHDLDGGQCSGHLSPSNTHGYPVTGEAHPVSTEQDTIVARDRQEVDVSVESTGSGYEPAGIGHVRVAVISWEMPVERRVRSTRSKPAVLSMASICSGSGR